MCIIKVSAKVFSKILEKRNIVMGKKSKKLTSLCVMLCMMFTQVLFTNATFAQTTAQAVSKVDFSSKLIRLAGTDRYQTAIEISKKGWSKSDYAVLATGEGYPDALCAGPLANKYGAPILLTQTDSLNADVLLEFKRLGVKNVFIIGGTGVISTNIEKTLKTQGITNVERLYGIDRYETSVKIAEKIGTSSKIAIATGSDFPDALSISAIASKMAMPILLTEKNSLPDKVKQYILNKQFDKTYIIGGIGVIGDAVKSQFTGAVRIGGNDRFETNTLVMQQFESALSFNKIYVAVGDGSNGDGFADALSGAVLAAKESSPIVLEYKTLSEITGNYIKSKVKLGTTVIALGGESVVPSQVADKMISYVNAIPVKTNYDKAGTYEPTQGIETISGNVVISVPDVILKNTIIEGDLLLSEGIGNGNVTLKDVTVKGTTIVKGGGPNSVVLYNFNGQEVRVDVPEGRSVRLVTQGTTSTGDITIVIPQGAQVILDGNFGTVNVETSGAQVKVQNGTIGTLNVGEKAAGADVSISSGAKVTNLNAAAPVDVTGTGTISTANITSKGVTIEQKPTITNVSSGIEANVGGQNVTGRTVTTPTPTPSGGGGGSSSTSGGGGGGSSSTVYVSGITVTGAGNATTVVNGKTLQMSAAVTPDNATDKTVTWSVTNGTGSATIDTNGLLTATKVGMVTVKVVAKDGSAKEGIKEITITPSAAEVTAALAAVNNATADSNYAAMQKAIEDNATILGLDLTTYNTLITERKPAVSNDLFQNKPSEGYTVAGLKPVFDEIVATRVVFQNSVNLVNDATAENPLKDVTFVTMLTENLSKVTKYTKHSGILIADKITALNALVTRYNALSADKKAAALKTVSSADYLSSTQTLDALDGALTTQEDAVAGELIAALAAVNNATADSNYAAMQKAIEDNATILGLDLTIYNTLITERKPAVSNDLFQNKPSEGYTVAGLKPVFDEIVATRVVFQNSVNLVNAATEANPLTDVLFVTMLTENLSKVTKYTKHSGILIADKITALNALVTRYNALSADKKAAALKTVSSADYLSSTQTLDALAAALTTQEDAVAGELTVALKAVNEATTNEAMQTAVEANANKLGLDLTTYNSLIAGRKTSVSVDLLGNKPAGGYTVAGLKLIFDEIVATRVVFQNSVNLVNAATEANPLTDVSFVTMLTDNLSKVTKYTTHSGIAIKPTLINTLTNLVTRYNALSAEKKTAALQTLIGKNFASSTETRNALDAALTTQEEAAEAELTAALKAVNNATADSNYAAMQKAIEDNATILGLDLTTYNTLITERKPAVSNDLFQNKPSEGYTVAGLKPVFDEIVTTRVVFQNSMDKVNNATDVAALDGISYVQMLIDNLNTVTKYRTHSGIAIKPTLINTLTNLVTRYNALSAEKKTAALQTLIGKNFASSTETRNALATALTIQEEAAEAEVTTALKAVNAAATNEAMQTAIEANSATLGLATGTNSSYDSLIAGRKTSVSVDLLDNKPSEGYTVAGLKPVFDEIVATRVVFQNSVNLVNAATEANPLTDVLFVTMLTDNLDKVTKYTKHSGIVIADKMTALQSLVTRYNALSDAKKTAALKTVSSADYLSSTQTLDALAAALTTQEEAAEAELTAELKAVNNATADSNYAAMQKAIEDNATILGLDLTTYNTLIDDRKPAVSNDLFQSKPTEGYTKDTLKLAFDEIVATRVVFQNSVNLVNAATEANPLTDVLFVTMLTDNLDKVTNYTKHSGIAIADKMTALQSLVTRYNALSDAKKTAALKTVSSADYLSSTQTLDALDGALTTQEDAVAGELTAALAAVNNATADSNYAAMQKAIEDNATILGLDLTAYNTLITERKPAVSNDLFQSKPSEGYTKDTLKSAFDEIVATRVVFQNSTKLVNDATVDKPLADVSFVTMLTDNLSNVKNYTKHSGIAIADKVAALQSLVNRYNALSADRKAAALKTVSSVDYLSSTQTLNALDGALTTQENAVAEEIEAAKAALAEKVAGKVAAMTTSEFSIAFADKITTITILNEDTTITALSGTGALVALADLEEVRGYTIETQTRNFYNEDGARVDNETIKEWLIIDGLVALKLSGQDAKLGALVGKDFTVGVIGKSGKVDFTDKYTFNFVAKPITAEEIEAAKADLAEKVAGKVAAMTTSEFSIAFADKITTITILNEDTTITALSGTGALVALADLEEVRGYTIGTQTRNFYDEAGARVDNETIKGWLIIDGLAALKLSGQDAKLGALVGKDFIVEVIGKSGKVDFTDKYTFNFVAKPITAEEIEAAKADLAKKVADKVAAMTTPEFSIAFADKIATITILNEDTTITALSGTGALVALADLEEVRGYIIETQTRNFYNEAGARVGNETIKEWLIIDGLVALKLSGQDAKLGALVGKSFTVEVIGKSGKVDFTDKYTFNFVAKPITAALKAVNEATTNEGMQAAIELNAPKLGLATGTNSSYDSLIAGRKTSVSVDLLDNKPSEGYTVAGLKPVFDEIVATRVVFQNSVNKVNNATDVAALDGVSYVQMLIDNLNTVTKYTTHSGIAIKPILIGTLNSLVTRYNALSAEKKTAALQTLIGKNFASSTQTRDALATALTTQENAWVAEVTAALKTVNEATTNEGMQAAIELNAPKLELATGTSSPYDSLIAGRKTSVSVDLLGNKPAGGYTVEGLKPVFDEIVATRVVFQDSVNKVNNATDVAALDGVSYVQMLIDNLNTVTKYTTHSGIAIKPTLIGTLNSLVTRYNALSAEKKTAALQTLIGKNFASSTQTRDALATALTTQENAAEAEVTAALKAVNNATADSNYAAMQKAIEDNAAILGLDLTIYNTLITERKPAVSNDLFQNKPSEGYTVAGLKPVFDEIVATRVVFQNSVNLVNDATAENPLKDVTFVTMLTENLSKVAKYTKHSGILITDKITALQSLVTRYNALSADRKAAALKTVSSADYLSSTQTLNALDGALTTQENAVAGELTAALAAVNNATADSNYAAMQKAIEDNATILGLDLTAYNTLITERKPAVSNDLFQSKPSEGYTKDTLKSAFDEIVATRVVFQNSTKLVNDATAENPLKDVTFVTMLTENLSKVAKYTKHSGILIADKITALNALVTRYNALSADKKAAALKTVSSADYLSSTQTLDALDGALTTQEDAVAGELTAALAAVNNATADSNYAAMQKAIEDNATILGLDLTTYNTLITERKPAVSNDLFQNKPSEGYTVVGLKSVFDEIVATRVVFQNSVNLVNDATAENPLKDVTFVTMLTENLSKVKNYTKHSGIAIADKVTALQSLVTRYNALSADRKAAALKTVSSADYLSSTQTLDALDGALTTQEDAVAGELTAEEIEAAKADLAKKVADKVAAMTTSEFSIAFADKITTITILNEDTTITTLSGTGALVALADLEEVRGYTIGTQTRNFYDEAGARVDNTTIKGWLIADGLAALGLSGQDAKLGALVGKDFTVEVIGKSGKVDFTDKYIFNFAKDSNLQAAQ